MLHEIRLSLGAKTSIAINAWKDKEDTEKGTKTKSRKQNNNIDCLKYIVKFAIVMLARTTFQNI